MKPLKTTAVCRLTPRGISIDLRVGRFRPRLLVIELPFADIDELVRVTYIEAACNPQLGPNESDMRECVRGRIPRPTMLHLVHGAGATLLIRGREFFYLITVEREGIDAVLRAYETTSRAPLPPRAAAAPP